MESRQFEKSVESHGEVPAAPTDQPERRRRFRIVKLEERIAPGGGGTRGTDQATHCIYCGDYTFVKKCV
jgi:hypothetical protein